MNTFMNRIVGATGTLVTGYFAGALVKGLNEVRKGKKIEVETERILLRTVIQLGLDSNELTRLEYDLLWNLTTEGGRHMVMARTYLELKLDGELD